MAERVRWAGDLAVAIHYLHEKGVRQGDIGGRNVLLDADRNILLRDFAGSGIDGEPPVVWAEGGFRHPPDEDPNTRTGTMPCELHALGSTIYELITSNCPHGGEEALCAGMAAHLLRQGTYPYVSNVMLGDIVEKCWKSGFASAQEVADCIYQKVREQPGGAPCFFPVVGSPKNSHPFAAATIRRRYRVSLIQLRQE